MIIVFENLNEQFTLFLKENGLKLGELDLYFNQASELCSENSFNPLKKEI